MTNVQETSKQAFESIHHELGERQQLVLNALYTLQSANNLMLAKFLSLPINSITPRLKELRDEKMVGFSHEGVCESTKRNTMFWKCTKLGELVAEKIEKPQRIDLLMRPFHVTEGDSYTRFTAQIKSSELDTFYTVEIQMVWDWENKEYYFKKFCECEGFLYRKDCKHCIRLQEELKKWSVI